MRKLGFRLLKYFYVGLITILPAYAIANNYQATVGSGTTFGSVVVSAVNYTQFMLCDLTTPATQCAAVDSSGNVSVSLKAETTKVIGTVNQGTSPWVVNTSTWAGGTLGSMANYGTSPGAVLAPGVNAYVTNTNANGQNTAANSSPVVLPAAQVTADVCALNAKTNIAISTTSGTTQLVAPSGSTQVYVCSIVTVGATASIQNLVGGTGAACTTGTPVAAIGSTTAANGMSFAANGGFSYGNGGGTIARTTTAGHGLCLIQSGTAQISGNLTYVQL